MMADIEAPLLAVFWDIENCRVPKGKSPMSVVHSIRRRFLEDRHKEAEFLCVCDVSKEPSQLLTQLNDAQVTVIHVSSEHKNAADEKLKQCMRRFSDLHKAPVTLVLISGDVDFAADLSLMRHTHRYRVILVHQSSSHVRQALAITANEIYTFEDFLSDDEKTDDLYKLSDDSDSVEDVHWVKITDLPTIFDLQKVRGRLSVLVNNTKGRIIHCNRRMAIAQYTQASWADRAAKRMNKQDVFGSKISACHISNVSSNSTNSIQPVLAQYQSSDQPLSQHSVQPHDFPTPPDSATLRSQQQFTGGGDEAYRAFPIIQKTPQKTPSCQSSATPTFSRTPGSKRFRSSSLVNSNSSSRYSTHTSATTTAAVSNVSRPFRKAPPLYQQWTDQMMYGSTHDYVSQPRFSATYNYFPATQLDSQQSTFRPITMQSDQLLPAEANTDSGYYSCTGGSSGMVGVPANKQPTDYFTTARAITGQPQRTPLYKRQVTPTGQEERAASGGVALAVSNLDYNITAREWKKILQQTFQQYVQVINVDVQTQTDGSCTALVHVANQEEARYAISQCHRKKVGYKRIQVSVYSPESPFSAQRIRSEVRAILSEVVGHTLPLFKFIEIYEKRFYRNISVSELYHMKDTVEIKEHSGKGRMVCLQSTLSSPTLANPILFNPSTTSSESMGLDEKPFCNLHCTPSDFTLLEECGMLPYVKIELSTLTHNVHTLVRLHDGTMPLLSFTYCYEAAFDKLVATNEGGVPLEHLISCVTNIQLRTDRLGVKKIVWVESRPSSPTDSSFSESSCASSTDSNSTRPAHSLSQQLSQFSREVVDLLKRMPACQMSFSKFIPAYHHHFGRQCRVADFGFTKLQELFEAIPHVLQILGTGNQRVLYLTHRIHLRRFTADLCRVLKAQPDKQCTVTEFADLYSETIGSDLVMANFGVCYVEDMLQELSDSQVLVSGSGRNTIMCIPKKDQTEEEMERTKQFSYEVVDLLRNCPQCTMAFNKFIPSYHHHFGRQCRVADFGFSKLIELFEAIPDTVIVTEQGEDRFISLTKTELFKVVSEQLLALLKACPAHCVEIRDLGPAYQKMYGHNIYIEEFGVESLDDLIARIPHIAHMEKRIDGDYVVINNRQDTETLAKRSLELLIERSNGEMRLSRFLERYLMLYADDPNLVHLKHELYPAILIQEDEQSGTIYLHPLMSLARRIRVLLSNNQGKLTLLTFEMAYRQSFGISLDIKKCGFPGVAVMLQMMDFMVSIRGRGARQTILLRQDYLSRLAHQLSFKIGIYSELVKYNEQERSAVLTDTSVTDNMTKGPHTPTGGVKASTTVIQDDDSIQSCSPDLRSRVSVGNITRRTDQTEVTFRTRGLHDASLSSADNSSMSAAPATSASISSELDNACRMLNSLTMEKDTRSVKGRSTNNQGSTFPNISMSLLMKNNPQITGTAGTNQSPRRARIAASFDKS